MPVSAVKMPVIPIPTFAFLKKFVQNIASVHDGMIYGKTNTNEMNFLYLRFVLVMSHATAPPKKIAMTDAMIAMETVFSSGR